MSEFEYLNMCFSFTALELKCECLSDDLTFCNGECFNMGLTVVAWSSNNPCTNFICVGGLEESNCETISGGRGELHVWWRILIWV